MAQRRKNISIYTFVRERNTIFFSNINNKEHTAMTTDVETKIIYLLLFYKIYYYSISR